MSCQEKKRKTTTAFIPDDLLFNCFARVSKLHYRTLSLVSKRFESLLTSPELYQIRSSLGRIETCLYLCLHSRRYPNPCWFTLCRKPNKTLCDKSSGYGLAPISSPNRSPPQSSELVAVGSEIYGIGSEDSSRVSVLDCWTHKWHEAPSMRVNRSISTASLLDGKIYVAGWSKDCNNSLDWVEVFDVESQTWGSVTNPGTQKRDDFGIKSLGFRGKFYLCGAGENVVYSPKESEWNRADLHINMCSAPYYSYCMIDNILFSWNDKVRWHDFDSSFWLNLQGVEEVLPDFLHCGGFHRLVNYDGKMVVLWNELVSAEHSYQENRIWCGQITLERRKGLYTDEIWGKVEWLDVVLTLPDSSLLSNADFFSVIV